MEPLECRLEISNAVEVNSTPITPFHIREQLRELINGPGSVSERVRRLLTESRSPFRIRERLVGKLSSEAVDIQKVSKALQEKLDIEGRTDGFHLGIICDGNRRWAKAHGLPKTLGHRSGRRVVEDIVFPVVSKIPQISELSVYLLSSSNLMGRDKEELENIYWLFESSFTNLLSVADEHNLCYSHAGAKEGLPAKMCDLLVRLEKETAGNDGMRINLCINYDSEQEEGYAMKRVLSLKSHEELDAMSPAELACLVRQNSWISTPVDAVVRTGGDPRFSGFLGNRSFDKDCHLLVEDKFLPDLTADDMLRHVFAFAKGERRMGL